MPAEQELESLVVRLLGDGSDYMKMLEQAERASVETAHALKAQGEQIEGFGNKVKEFAHTSVEAIEAFGIERFLHHSFEAFSEKQAVMIGLKSIMEAHGRDVQELTADYTEFSKYIAETTLLSEKQSLQLLRTAENYGLTGESAKLATELSVGFGTSTGQNAESMMRLSAALASGNVQLAMHLGRMVPALQQFRGDPEKFLAEARKLAEAGLKQNAEQAETAAGAVKQLSKAWEELEEAFGQTAAELIGPVVKSLKLVVDWIQTATPETKQMIVYALAFAAAMASIGPATYIANIALGPLLALLGTAGSLFAGLVSPMGIVTGLLVAGAAAWLMYSDAGQQTVEQLSSTWEMLKGDAQNAAKGVTDALAGGNLQLAIQIGWDALKLAFMKFTSGLVKTALAAAYEVADIWEKAMETGSNLGTKLITDAAKIELTAKFQRGEFGDPESMEAMKTYYDKFKAVEDVAADDERKHDRDRQSHMAKYAEAIRDASDAWDEHKNKLQENLDKQISLAASEREGAEEAKAEIARQHDEARAKMLDALKDKLQTQPLKIKADLEVKSMRFDSPEALYEVLKFREQFASGTFSGVDVSPQVKEQQKTNEILTDIRDDNRDDMASNDTLNIKPARLSA